MKESKMILAQNFALHPFGNVRSGRLSYSYDTERGLAEYNATITVKKFFFTVTKTFSGKTLIPTEFFTSKKFVAGFRTKFGPLVIEVKSISGSMAHCAISLATADTRGDGLIDVDISQSWARIAKMADSYMGRARLRVADIDLNLVLENA